MAENLEKEKQLLGFPPLENQIKDCFLRAKIFCLYGCLSVEKEENDSW